MTGYELSGKGHRHYKLWYHQVRDAKEVSESSYSCCRPAHRFEWAAIERAVIVWFDVPVSVPIVVRGVRGAPGVVVLKESRCGAALVAGVAVGGDVDAPAEAAVEPLQQYGHL